MRASSNAVQILGGYGFTKDYPAEKYYRDSKLATSGEGTSKKAAQQEAAREAYVRLVSRGAPPSPGVEGPAGHGAIAGRARGHQRKG